MSPAKEKKYSVIEKEEDTYKVDNILNTAQKKFGLYGLDKTTMNEIAEEIGMSKAFLYYYFPDKESLFKAVIKKEQDEFVNEINKIIKTSSEAAIILHQYIKKRQTVFLDFLNLSKLKYNSMVKNKPCIGKLHDAFRKQEVELIESILKIGTSNKEFRKIKIREYAELFVSIMQGLRLATMKNKDSSLLDLEDHSYLNKKMTKIADMFIKELKA